MSNRKMVDYVTLDKCFIEYTGRKRLLHTHLGQMHTDEVNQTKKFLGDSEWMWLIRCRWAEIRVLRL